MKYIFSVLALFLAMTASAHQIVPPQGQAELVVAEDVLRQINSLYQKTVAPIFEQKCFDCHSTKTKYPWYYNLPIVKQWMDSDMQEAREHFDFTGGFPFKGHHPASKQPSTLAESVSEGDMPPWDYRLMHKGSSLTEEEKKIILDWAQSSQSLLK